MGYGNELYSQICYGKHYHVWGTKLGRMHDSDKQLKYRLHAGHPFAFRISIPRL